MDNGLDPKDSTYNQVYLYLLGIVCALLLGISLYFGFSTDELKCYLPEGCPPSAAEETEEPGDELVVPLPVPFQPSTP